MQAESLSRTSIIGYASGNLAKAFQFGVADIFLLYFLTEIIGLEPVHAGSIIFVSLVFDALTDPWVATIVDRVRNHFGNYAIAIVMFAPFSALSLWALFALPLLDIGNAYIVSLIATLLFRLGYTFVDIPHNAILSSLPQSDILRTEISAWRFFFSASATLALAAFSYTILDRQRDVDAQIILNTVALVAALYFLIMLVSGLSVKREQNAGSARAVEAGHLGLRHKTQILFKSPSFRQAVFLVCLLSGLISSADRIIAFLPQLRPEHEVSVALLLTAYAAGKMVSLPFWVFLTRRFGGKRTFFIIVTALAGGATLLACSFFTPFNALQPAYFILGLGSAGAVTMVWAIAGKAIDSVMATSSQRFDGLAFGIFIMLLKVASGFGALFFSWVLQIATRIAQSHAADFVLGYVVCAISLGIVGLGAVFKARA